MAVAIIAAGLSADTLSFQADGRDGTDDETSEGTEDTTLTPPSLGSGGKTRRHEERRTGENLVYAVPVKTHHVVTDWKCSQCGCALTVDIKLRADEDEAEHESSSGDDAEQERLEPNTWRNRLWLVVEVTEDPPPLYRILSSVVSCVGVLAILLSVVVFIVETHPGYHREAPPELFAIETACIIYFTVELLLRAVSCPHFKAFLKEKFTIIDILSIVPYYIAISVGSDEGRGLIMIRVLRLLRVFRIFKVSKYSVEVNIVMASLARSTEGLYLLLFLIFLSTVLFSSAMYFTERESLSFDNVTDSWISWEVPDPGDYKWTLPHLFDSYFSSAAAANVSTSAGTAAACSNATTPSLAELFKLKVPRVRQKSPFQSILHSSWWCLVTLTTVGYGDDVPSSVAGKAVAVATMLCGTLVIAFPMVIIGQNFQEAYKNYKRSTREKELRRKPNMLKYLRGKSRAGGDYPGGNSDCGSMMSGQRRAKTGSSIPRPEGGIRITPQASAVPSTTGSLVGGSPLSRAQPTRPKRTASALTQGSQAVSALGGEPFTFEMIPMKRASRVMSQTFPVASNVPSESAIGEAHSRGEDSAKIAEVSAQLCALEDRIQDLLKRRRKSKHTRPSQVPPPRSSAGLH